MFNIGDEVRTKSTGEIGIVTGMCEGKEYRTKIYGVKFENSSQIYTESELMLASMVSKTKTVPKFKIGDEVIYGELYYNIGIIKDLKQNNGKNTYRIFNKITGVEIIRGEEKIKLLKFKDQKGNRVERSKKITISDIDYSIKSDQNKPQLSLVPIKQLWTAIARVREHGIEEYGDNDSWKKVELKRYHNALLRHCSEIDTDLNAIDKKSGLPHRWHIACNLAFIEELLKNT